MIRLTLAQMRRSTGRLVAAGIAIVIGAGFVTATLLASTAVTKGSQDAVTAQYGKADLVATQDQGQGWDLTHAQHLAATIAETQGVTATSVDVTRYVTLSSTNSSPAKSSRLRLMATTSNPALRTYGIAQGRAPQRDDEIALPERVASQLDLALGDTVSTTDLSVITATRADADNLVVAPGTAGTADAINAPVTWTIVGLDADPSGAYLVTGLPGVVTPAGLSRFSPVTSAIDDGQVTLVEAPYASTMLIALGAGADEHQVADSLRQAHPGWTITSRIAAANAAMSSMSDGQNVFLYFLLAFASIALLVAALVIANTFQVIVAHRRRTLALLRCTGASASQLRRSVLQEALLLGGASSVAGVLLGAGLVQVALLVVRGMSITIPLPHVIHLTPVSVIVPILVGTVVTALAAFGPANATAKVSPLAALRPQEPTELRSRAGMIRMLFAGLLAVGGGLLLVGGITIARSSVALGLVAGVLGGAASFVGITLAATFWLPPLARGAGRLLSHAGPAARLAAANALRNPRRTAATSTALLIGVTLVTMMSVGAASARASIAGTLDEHFPVDVSTTLTPDIPVDRDHEKQLNQLAYQASHTVAGVNGVQAAVPVLTTDVLVTSSGDRHELDQPTFALSAPDAATVLPDPGAARSVHDGEIVLGSSHARVLGNLHEGDILRLGSAQGPSVTVHLTSSRTKAAYVTPATMNQVRPRQALERVVWASLAPHAAPQEVVDEIDSALVAIPHWTEAPGAERAFVEQAITTLLTVIVALLAVAVIIALIGVANTLALSVLERRRESATLRSIGLSKRQLRSMLAIEGLFIAGAGTVAGVVLGLLYGWAGSWIVLNAMGDVQFGLPWRDIAVVIAVGLGAGLVASVAPARTATRTSPVEALAVE